MKQGKSGISSETTIQERVQELTWALTDEHLDDAGRRQLEQLLVESDEARQTYVECMEVHAGLQWMFDDGLRERNDQLLRQIAQQQGTDAPASPPNLLATDGGPTGDTTPLASGETTV